MEHLNIVSFPSMEMSEFNAIGLKEITSPAVLISFLCNLEYKELKICFEGI